jgi:hypothetical protein
VTRDFRPIAVGDIELTRPLPPLADIIEGRGGAYGSAQLLVRYMTEPIGVVDIPIEDGTSTSDALAAAIWRELGPRIANRAVGCARRIGSLPMEGLTDDRPSPYLLERARILADAPRISVILCTRDPDERIGRTLRSLERQQYPDFEVLVVDNAPTGDAVASVLANRLDASHLRRVVEPRPGLAWARNRGLRESVGEIVAFIDDDAVADSHWLAELARGFIASKDVAAVTGPVLPTALETPEQVWMEQFGGLCKGRGFERWIFDVASHTVQHPLYPSPSFGVGANMSFRRSDLLELGGFDVALGSGTPVRSGEDGALISQLMLTGRTVVYEPGALVRHEHRRTWAELTTQFYGLGVGLTAFYTRLLLMEPARLLTLLRLLPRALRDRAMESVQRGEAVPEFPRDLIRLQRLGMLAGPSAYLRSRRLQTRIARDGLPVPVVPWSRSQ